MFHEEKANQEMDKHDNEQMSMGEKEENLVLVHG